MKQKDGFNGEQVIVLPQMAIDIESADPLASSLYITDIGYYPKAAGHYRERTQPISQYVLIYCVEGAGWYCVGGERHDVGADQYVILPAGKPHTYAADEQEPWTIYWVHFTGAHAAIYAEGALRPNDVKPGAMSRISERNNIFEEIFVTLRNGYGRENLRYASSLLHHYLASMRYITLFRNADPKPRSTDVVGAAIHYMKENAEKHLSLRDIAGYTGYSPSHFSSMFKQQTGHSPLGYFNLLKINLACRLLASTGMKVNQICHKVGIEDCYYFSRLFCQDHGHVAQAIQARKARLTRRRRRAAPWPSLQACRRSSAAWPGLAPSHLPHCPRGLLLDMWGKHPPKDSSRWRPAGRAEG